jgi:hypothetical protein
VSNDPQRGAAAAVAAVGQGALGTTASCVHTHRGWHYPAERRYSTPSCGTTSAVQGAACRKENLLLGIREVSSKRQGAGGLGPPHTCRTTHPSDMHTKHQVTPLGAKPSPLHGVFHSTHQPQHRVTPLCGSCGDMVCNPHPQLPTTQGGTSHSLTPVGRPSLADGLPEAHQGHSNQHTQHLNAQQQLPKRQDSKRCARLQANQPLLLPSCCLAAQTTAFPPPPAAAC